MKSLFSCFNVSLAFSLIAVPVFANSGANLGVIQVVPLYTFSKPVPACPAQSTLRISSTQGLVCQKPYCPAGSQVGTNGGLYCWVAPTPCPAGTKGVISSAQNPYCAAILGGNPKASDCPAGTQFSQNGFSEYKKSPMNLWHCFATPPACPSPGSGQPVVWRDSFFCKVANNPPPTGEQLRVDENHVWNSQPLLTCSSPSSVSLASKYPKVPPELILMNKTCVKGTGANQVLH